MNIHLCCYSRANELLAEFQCDDFEIQSDFVLLMYDEAIRLEDGALLHNRAYRIPNGTVRIDALAKAGE